MMTTFVRPGRVLALGVLCVLGAPGVAGASPKPQPAPDTQAASNAGPPLNFVYFDPQGHQRLWGDTKDIEDARRFRHGDEPLLWFREDRQAGREFIIRDPALLKQLDEVSRPMEDIGTEMGKVGGRQGGLGAQQGALGTQLGVLSTRQSALSVREAALDMRSDNAAPSPDATAELARQRKDLRRQRKHLEKKMAAINASMQELSTQMTSLNEEMQVLDKKMRAAVVKATTETHELFRRSIASGVAKPAR
jgi:bla regulator protein BlaR1